MRPHEWLLEFQPYSFASPSAFSAPILICQDTTLIGTQFENTRYPKGCLTSLQFTDYVT
jgi:hypothetical protein